MMICFYKMMLAQQTGELVGENTDYRGIMLPLRAALLRREQVILQ